MPLYDDARSAWGAAKPIGTIRSVTWAEKTEIFWHYVDGNPVGLSGKPHTDCLRKVKQFQTFHMSSARGWSDIGYNALVCQHGRLIEGRGILTVGAHCPNHNRQGIGVQFMVGGSEKPTAVAYARAVRFLTEATATAGHTFRVLGHRDGTATQCPGSVIYGWLQSGMPSALTPAPTPTPVAPSEEDDMPLNEADLATIGQLVEDKVKVAFIEMQSRATAVDRQAGTAFWQLVRDGNVPLTAEVALQKEALSVLANSQGLNPDLIAKLIADKIAGLELKFTANPTTTEETP